MKSSVALALALLAVACGGETTEPLSATFPMGPRQLRLAIDQRFSDVLTPDASSWPANEPETTVDLTMVRAATLTLPSAPPFAGKALKLDPAFVSVDLDNPPVDEIELLVGPAGVTDVSDPHVQSVAHGPVPRSRKENSVLTWSANGPELLEAALEGKLDGQKGSRSLTFFLRGRSTVTLEPGQPLPGSDAEAHVALDIPLRYSP